MADLILSIRQPWAWLILNGGKDIENRSWPTRVRGRILIHAAKGMTGHEYESAASCMCHVSKYRPFRDGLILPSPLGFERGGIVGSVEIVYCVSKSDSPWFFGPYGFVLRNPEPLPFRPMRGALGFFRAPATP